jgi:signal transduction histidine kinase
VHDITRQKETEAVLMSAQAELARAKRLSDIGTLAATVAHELRNPLATIGMAAINIKRKSKNRDLDKHLANIDKKVFESNQIINNLLFYSRLKPPHYELVDIYALLEEAVRAAREGLKEGVHLSSNISGLRNVRTEVDPIQIREVLFNLLNNAADAVTAESGRIEVSGALEDGCVIICVKDSGEGMDEETLLHAFDPFFTTKAKGTGLGLPVCRQIMDFHKGEISLAGEPGKGTIARVTLPKKRRDARGGCPPSGRK